MTIVTGYVIEESAEMICVPCFSKLDIEGAIRQDVLSERHDWVQPVFISTETYTTCSCYKCGDLIDTVDISEEEEVGSFKEKVKNLQDYIAGRKNVLTNITSQMEELKKHFDECQATITEKQAELIELITKNMEGK